MTIAKWLYLRNHESFFIKDGLIGARRALGEMRPKATDFPTSRYTNWDQLCFLLDPGKPGVRSMGPDVRQ